MGCVESCTDPGSGTSKLNSVVYPVLAGNERLPGSLVP